MVGSPFPLLDPLCRLLAQIPASVGPRAAAGRHSPLNAVGETENALSTYDASLRHIEIVEKLCVQNQEALTLAIKRYKDSLSPMTDVVNAQLNALAGESELVQAQESALTSLVSLYEALGGGISLDD